MAAGQTNISMPPPLHTRNTNEMYEQPTTPIQGQLVSPQQTPQGSPSKHQQPPGAFDLPNVFDNAMKLLPTHNKTGRQQLSPSSPNKNGNVLSESDQNGFSAYDMGMPPPSSPTRQSAKENTPPQHLRPALKTESSFVNHAAQSRQAPYKPNEAAPAQYQVQRGLSKEDLEKLQKPSVKRLANVTQLCAQHP